MGRLCLPGRVRRSKVGQTEQAAVAAELEYAQKHGIMQMSFDTLIQAGPTQPNRTAPPVVAK